MSKLGDFLYRGRKAVTRPFWKAYRLLFPSRYRPKAYWGARLGKYGLDLRGVGNCTKSSEENEARYAGARAALLEFCRDRQVLLTGARVLDIGCGTGFYAAVLQDEGVQEYTGVDITDALLSELSARFAGFRFEKCDVSESLPAGPFDVVIMIDVTQHITDDRKFQAAMENIGRVLDPNGVFLVTSWLTKERVQRQPHEVARPMSSYEREFTGWTFSEPVPFGDKFLFAVRRAAGKAE